MSLNNLIDKIVDEVKAKIEGAASDQHGGYSSTVHVYKLFGEGGNSGHQQSSSHAQQISLKFQGFLKDADREEKQDNQSPQRESESQESQGKQGRSSQQQRFGREGLRWTKIPDEELREALELHNPARKEANKIGVERPPLMWSNTLAESAQKYANELARTEKWGHDKYNVSEGENLSMSTRPVPLRRAIQLWLDEKKHYNGQRLGGGSNFATYGHYTAIIWPTTTKVGIARARSRSGKQYMVARYSPRGNVMGESAYTYKK